MIKPPINPAPSFALASLGVLAEKNGVHVRFLLGPAGSGKTFRCLEEIRAELLASPEGPPLVLLAPKQATFQLERQLLGGGSLPGYTRLHILSFERLADFVLRQAQTPPRELLSEEGRTMVLRALLMRHKDELRIFRASAGLSGFAKQLSVDLRELQRHQLSAEKLARLATLPNLPPPLRYKLHDFSVLLRAYLEWVRDHNLEDASRLLDLAAESLVSTRARAAFAPEPEEGGQGIFSFSFFHGSSSPSKLRIAGLWLDGFAEMTPQELSLLAALAPCVDKLTLAFCVNEEQARSVGGSWLSIWSGVNQTRINCRARLSAIAGATFEEERLPGPHPTRFAENPALAHLEKHWTRPQPFDGDAAKSVRLVIAPTPQAEAIQAAREIRRFVRAGGRYREAAVLLRSMNGYHDELRRAFLRYEIPFFLDRREAVSHHPLAELTRCALSTLAFNWRQEDWFGALKTGLVSPDENAIDQMENEALARGWKGDAWLKPLSINCAPLSERLRERWVAPFLALKQNLSLSRPLAPSGRQLGEALRIFWGQLRVEETLEQWSAMAGLDHPFAAPHATVWEQLNAWVDDIALAFAEESMALQEWLPILEAGLSGLSVGVIPPALDQVLIGTVDRSRNPELRLALVLGANESVFPAAPVNRNLLTDADRDALERCDVALGQNTRQLLSRERFLGYIACTRPRARLVLSASQRDAKDTALNPSPFFSQLKALFPSVEIEEAPVATPLVEAEHASELIGPLLRNPALAWPDWTLLTALRERFSSLAVQTAGLSPALAGRLYGPALKTSVSRLENYAACPFKFFLDSGLGAEERRHFELDVREKGSFQHAVLAEFHAQIRAERRRWHDLAPAEAREKVGAIADRLAPHFREGLLQSDAQTRFAARSMKASLQDFIATLIGWMPQYDFEPEAVELGFGQGENAMPAWELDLDGARRLIFRGIIDRIDLCTIDSESALAVVIDYKSSARKLDKVMMQHGLQLQLLAYLSVLRHLREPERFFKAARLIPGGVFYVNLRGQVESGKTRAQVLGQLDETRQAAYQHTGRFDQAILRHLDNRCPPEGAQFKFKLKKDGEPSKQVPDPMPSADFACLLDTVEENLVRMGREIFAGSSEPAPYQKGKERACDLCDFAGICRIDPWTHKFRILRAID